MRIRCRGRASTTQERRQVRKGKARSHAGPAVTERSLIARSLRRSTTIRYLRPDGIGSVRPSAVPRATPSALANYAKEKDDLMKSCVAIVLGAIVMASCDAGNAWEKSWGRPWRCFPTRAGYNCEGLDGLTWVKWKQQNEGKPAIAYSCVTQRPDEKRIRRTSFANRSRHARQTRLRMAPSRDFIASEPTTKATTTWSSSTVHPIGHPQ